MQVQNPALERSPRSFREMETVKRTRHMRSKSWKIHLICGLTLLVLGGCYSYRPYGSGLYGPPSMGPAYPSGGAPATLAPQGGLTPYNAQAPTYGGDAPGWQQPTNGSLGTGAPSFNSTGTGFSQPTDGNAVPNYNDPGNADGGDGGLRFNESEADAPFGENGALRTGVETNNLVSAEQHDSFVTPADFNQPMAADTPSNEETANRPPIPFEYDRENYARLCGVVDYDRSDKSWNIIYSMKPDPTDRYGGSMTLIDNGGLGNLRDGNVVLVTGSVDTDALDRFGKPSYRIERLSRLVPKKK